MSPRFASPHPQQGIALPVMLIMLLVMLVSSIYLLRSSNSTTLTATNLAQDSALARAADLGLHTGFRWLSETAQTGKARLNRHVPEQGYRANLDTTLTVRSSEFWDGSRELVDALAPAARAGSSPPRWSSSGSIISPAAASAVARDTVRS